MPFVDNLLGPGPEAIVSPSAASNVLDLGKQSSGQIETQVQDMYDTRWGIASKLGALAYGGTLGLVDQTLSSLHITEPHQIDRAALNAIGSPGLSDWYEGNKGAMEVGGAVSAVIGGAFAAKAFVDSSGAAMRFAAKSPWTKGLAALERNSARNLDVMQAAHLNMARDAAIGMDQYIGSATISRLGVKSEVSLAATRNAYVRSRMAEGLAQNVAHEAFLFAFANSNNVLFSDSMSENLLWAAGGLAGGGVIDSVMAKYSIRKFANSDELRRTFAKANDPFGTESARLDPALRAPTAGQLGGLGHTGGIYSDNVVSHMLSVQEGRNPENVIGGTRAPLFARRNRLATQQEQDVRNLMNKITTSGIPGVGGTAFGMKATSAGAHLDHANYLDPVFMLGVEEIGVAGRDLPLRDIASIRQGEINKRFGQIEDMIQNGGIPFMGTTNGKPVKKYRKFKPGEREALLDESKQLRFRNSGVEMRAVDGQWVSPEVGNLFAEYHEPTIELERTPGLTVWKGSQRAGGGVMAIDSDLNITLPRGVKLNKLGLHESLTLHRLGGRLLDSAVNQWQSAKPTAMVLPKNPSWFQLDMAEMMIRRTGTENSVRFPKGLDRETALVASFKQKAAIMRELPDPDDPDAVIQLAYTLNLPRLSTYESGLYMTDEHPVEIVLRGLAANPNQSLTYPELIKAVEDARNITGIASDAKTHGDQTLGNMFDFGLNEGKPLEQVIAFKRPMAPDQMTKSDLAERLALGKSYVRHVMTGAGAGQFTKTLTNSMLTDPDFYAASQVDQLMDLQVMPSTPGFGMSAPQTITGRALNDITPREFRDRDSNILAPMTRVRSRAERAAQANAAAKMEAFIGNTWDGLNGPRNAASKLLVDTFMSTRRAGWELKLKNGQPVITSVSLPGNKPGFAFILDDQSQANQARFQRIFHRAMDKNQQMLTGKGVPVVVDERGLDFLQRYDQMMNDIRAEDNTLLAAKGLGSIRAQPHYIPPPSLKGKFVGYTLDESGKPVQHGTIIARTPDEFNRMKKILESDPDSPLLKPGARFYTREDIENFLSAEDRAQMDWIEPGTVAALPGKRAEGTLTGLDVNLNASGEAMEWARDKYLRMADGVIRTLMDDTINAVRARAQIARTSKLGKTGQSEAAEQSVYDYWLQNMSGTQTIKTGGSLMGAVARPITGIVDSALAGAGPHMARTFRGAMDFVREHDFTGRTKTTKQKFEELYKSLGQYMPYRGAVEYAERSLGAKAPANLSQITGHMSWFESLMRLRMFEVIHPVMNLGGIVNAMPAVIQFAQPTKAERAAWATTGAAEYAARVGHLVDNFNLPNGQPIGMLSMPKLLAQTFKDTWNRKSHADWDYMVSRGFVTQEVAELHRQMGLLDSVDGWKKVFVGDPLARNRAAHGLPSVFSKKGIGEHYRAKGLLGMVSTLSDLSEDFSRSWGHMAGLRLADTLGITGREARHSFAHDIANKMIANYDPKNRPAIFQGALGAPIGLFQSFIWNYYQRLFRYIETGSARAAATQYATQAALFGITGLTGFQAINDMFFQNADGSNSPLDQIYERFGKETGDLLMAGTLSNLPKLANLLPGEQGMDGLNLYSRGDTTVRLPAVQAPPVIDTLRRVKNGIEQGLAMFSADNPNKTPTQLAEILSNMLTNRPMAGFVETMLADGYDTDKSGQVVAQSKGFLENTARIIGIRSIRQSKEMEAFYANKSAQEIQAALRQKLNRSARAAIRAGDVDSLPGYFEKYIESGGRPEYFNRWMKDNMQAALKTRGERMLEQMLKNPRHAALLQRLVTQGVEISDLEDEDTAPPLFDMSANAGQDAPITATSGTVDWP